MSTSVNWLGNVLVSATFLSLASPHVLTQVGGWTTPHVLLSLSCPNWLLDL